MTAHVGEPLTYDTLTEIYDRVCEEIASFADTSETIEKGNCTIHQYFGLNWHFMQDGEEQNYRDTTWISWRANASKDELPEIPIGCEGAVITGWEFTDDPDEEYDNDTYEDGGEFVDLNVVYEVTVYLADSDEKSANRKKAYSETGQNIPLTSENVKDIMVNCDLEKALEESDEGEINSDDPSYYYTVEVQTPDGETLTIVEDVELSWQDQVDRLQVDIPSDLSGCEISSYDVSASVDESEDEGEDWHDMGDYGYMDHYDCIHDDVHVVITLYLTK